MGRSIAPVPCNDSTGSAATFNCTGATSAPEDLDLGSSPSSAEAASSVQCQGNFKCGRDFGLLDRSVVTMTQEQPTPALPAATHGLAAISIELTPPEDLRSPPDCRTSTGLCPQGPTGRLIAMESGGPSMDPSAFTGASICSSSVQNGSLRNTGLQSDCATAPLRLGTHTGPEHSNSGNPKSPLRSVMNTQTWPLQLIMAAACLAIGAVLVTQFAGVMRACARQLLSWPAAGSSLRIGTILGSDATVTAAAAATLSLAYLLATLRPVVSALCAAGGLLVCATTLRDFVRQRRLGSQELRGTGNTNIGLGSGAPSSEPTLASFQHHSVSTLRGADAEHPQSSQELQIPADVEDTGGKDLVSSGTSWSPFATESAPRRSVDVGPAWRTSGRGSQRPSAAATRSVVAAGGGGGGSRPGSCDIGQQAVMVEAALVGVMDRGSLLAAGNSPSLQNWAMPSTSSEEQLIAVDVSLGGVGNAPSMSQVLAPSPTNATARRSATDIHGAAADDSDSDDAAIIIPLPNTKRAALDEQGTTDTASAAAMSCNGGTTSVDAKSRHRDSVWRRVWSCACRMALPGLHLLDRSTLPTTSWDRPMGPSNYSGGGPGCGGQDLSRDRGRHRRPSGWSLLWPRPDLQATTAGGVAGGWLQPLVHPGLSNETSNNTGMHLAGLDDRDENGGSNNGIGNGGTVTMAVTAVARKLQSGLFSTARSTLTAGAQLVATFGGGGLYAALWGHGFGGFTSQHPRQSTSSVRQMVSDLLPLVTGSFIPRTLSDTSLNMLAMDPCGSGADVSGGAAALLLNSAGAARKPAFSDLAINAGRVQVLSVDDEPVNQQVMRALLWAAEYDVLEAASGEEALELLRSCEVLPDLVLLDVTLGGQLSGFEVCREIRCEYSPGELPVIMITCSSLEEDVIRGLAVGANDYMIKPLRNLELMARIKTQLALKRSIRVAAEARVNMSLLGSILPANVIRQLKQGVTLIAQFHEEVTILFSDIRGFTNLATEWPTEQIILMLNNMFTAFDRLCDEMGVYKVETIGDAYMIVSGHDGVADHAARMLRMASAMLMAVADMRGFGGQELQIRVGIHTGPAHSGVVGLSRPRYCFFGDTVNTASRMESTGFPMAIQVSESTLRAIKSRSEWAEEFAFVSCGSRDIKGKGIMPTYLLQRGLYNEALMELAAVAAAAERAAASQQRRAQLSRSTTPPATATTAAAAAAVAEPHVKNTQDRITTDTVTAATTPGSVDAAQATSSSAPPTLPVSTSEAFSAGGSTNSLTHSGSDKVLMASSPFSIRWPIPSGPGALCSSGGDPAGDMDFPRYASYRYHHHPLSVTDAISSAGTNVVIDNGLAATLASPTMEGPIQGLLEDTGCNRRLGLEAETSSGGAGQPSTAAVAAPQSPSDASIGRDDAAAAARALPPATTSLALLSGSGGSSATGTSSSAAASVTAAGIIAGCASEGPMGRSASVQAGGIRTLSPPASTRPSVDMLGPISTSSTNDDPVWGNGQATTTTDTDSLSIAARNGRNVSISRTGSVGASVGWGPHSPTRDSLVYGAPVTTTAGICPSNKDSPGVASSRMSGSNSPEVSKNGEEMDEPTLHGCLSPVAGRGVDGHDKVAGVSRVTQRVLEQSRGVHHSGATDPTRGIAASNIELRRSTSGELSAAAAVAASASNVSADKEAQAARPATAAVGGKDSSASRGFGGKSTGAGERFPGQMIGWSLLVEALDPERSLDSDGAAGETLGAWMNVSPPKRAPHSSSAALAAPQQSPQRPTLQALERWHAADVYDPSAMSGAGVTGFIPSAAFSSGFIPIGAPSVAVAAEALAAAVDSALYDSVDNSSISHAVTASGIGSAGCPYSTTNIQQCSSLGISNRGRLSMGSSLGRGGADAVRAPFRGTLASSNGSSGPQTLFAGSFTDAPYKSAVRNEGASHPPPTANPHASRLYCTSSQGGVVLGTRSSYERPSDASATMTTGAQGHHVGSQHRHQQHMAAAASGPTPARQVGGDGGGSSMGQHVANGSSVGGGSGGRTLSPQGTRRTGSQGCAFGPGPHQRRPLTATGVPSAPEGTATANASYFLAGGGSSGGGSGIDGGDVAALTVSEGHALYRTTVRRATTARQLAPSASSRRGPTSGALPAAAPNQAPVRLLTAPTPLSHVYGMAGSEMASRRKSVDVPGISRFVGRAATVQGISTSAGLSNNVQAAQVDSQFRHSTSSGQGALRHVQSARWPTQHPNQLVPGTDGGSGGISGGVLSSYGSIALGSAGGGVSIISQGWSNLYDPLCPRPRLTDHYASGDNLDETFGAPSSGCIRSPSVGSGHAWESSPAYKPQAIGGGGVGGGRGANARPSTSTGATSYRGPAAYRDQVNAVSRPSFESIVRAGSLDVDAAEVDLGASVHGSSQQGQGPLLPSPSPAPVVERQPQNTEPQQKTHMTALGGSQQSRTRPHHVASMQRHAYDKIIQVAYQTGGTSSRGVEKACAGSAGRAASRTSGHDDGSMRISRSHSLDVNRTVSAEAIGMGNAVTSAAAAAVAGKAATIPRVAAAAYGRQSTPPATAQSVSVSAASAPRPLMARMSMDTSMSLICSASTLAATAATAPSGLPGFEHLEHYQRLHSPELHNCARWSPASGTVMISSLVSSAARSPTTAGDAARCYRMAPPQAHPLSPDTYVGESVMPSPGSAKSGVDRTDVSTVAFSPPPSNGIARSAASTFTGVDGGQSPVIIPGQSEGSSQLSAKAGDTVALSAQQQASRGMPPSGSALGVSPRQHGPVMQQSATGNNIFGGGTVSAAKYSCLSSRHSVDIPVLSRQVSASPIMRGGRALEAQSAVSDGGQSAAVPVKCGPRVSSLMAAPLPRASDNSVGNGGGVHQRKSASTSTDIGSGDGAGNTVRMKGELRKILEPSAHSLVQQGSLAASSAEPSWSPRMVVATDANTPGAGAAGLDIACMLARASERSAGITLAPASHSASTVMVATATAAPGQQKSGGGVQLPPVATTPSAHEPVAVAGLPGDGMTDGTPAVDGVSTDCRRGDMDGIGGEVNNPIGGASCCSLSERYQQHAHHHAASPQHRLAHSYSVANGLVQPLIPSRLDPVEEGCGSSAAFTGEAEYAASVDGSVVGGGGSMDGAKERGTAAAVAEPRVNRNVTGSHDAALPLQQTAKGQQGTGLQSSSTAASESAGASTATSQVSAPAVASGDDSPLSFNDMGMGLAPAPVERVQAKQVEAVSKRSFSSLVQKVKRALRPGEGTGRGVR